MTLSFTRKTTEKDHIFGSVTAADIKEALDAQGFAVDKKRIVLPEPIKQLGSHKVTIKVYHDDKAEIQVDVVAEEEPPAETEAPPAEA